MDDEAISQLGRNLAENLRGARERRGVSQAALAQACGIPRSTIASIESGSSNPTLGVLSRLSASLQLSIEELLSPPHGAVQLFRRGSLPVRVSGRDRSVTVHKLLPDPIPGMEIDRMQLEPGAHKAGVPHQSGTREYLSCEQGALTLWVDGERFELRPGDVAAFPGDCRHSYRCAADAQGPAVGFSVVVLAPASVRAAS